MKYAVTLLIFLLGTNFGCALSSGRLPGLPKERRPRIPTTADRRWEVKPIGRVESPYQQKFGTPKQATVEKNDGGKVAGKIHIFPEFQSCYFSFSSGVVGFLKILGLPRLLFTRRINGFSVSL